MKLNKLGKLAALCVAGCMLLSGCGTGDPADIMELRRHSEKRGRIVQRIGTSWSYGCTCIRAANAVLFPATEKTPSNAACGSGSVGAPVCIAAH